MSTLISDLPGPQEEYAEEYDEYTNENEPQNEYTNEVVSPETFENENEFKGKIIKKKTIDFDFKDELNMENVLLLCILFIATMPQLNETIRKVLGMFVGSGYSHGFVTIIKCILLVILFILVKKFVLV
jgi:hypothetical protein